MESTTAGEAPVSIEFDVRALAPVALFMAQTDPRYYLNGICVQPNRSGPGCFVIGCDGHRLAIWHDATGKCSKQTVFKVSKELIAASRKKPAKDGRVCFEGGRVIVKDRHEQETFIQAGQAEIKLGHTDHKGRPSVHQYPDVWRVVPKASALVPGLRGAINGRYIEAIGKAARLLEVGGGLYGHGCSVWHFSSGDDGNGSVVTRFANAKDFIVITMPRREDGFTGWAPLPEYFRQPDLRDSVPATVSYPVGSMGEEVAL